MKAETKHRQSLKNRLQSVLNAPEARLVENRYRTLRYSLLEAYPTLIGTTQKEVILNLLKDAIYLDRLIRKETEGEQPFKKKILSQDFQISQLGYKN